MLQLDRLTPEFEAYIKATHEEEHIQAPENAGGKFALLKYIELQVLR